jgi:hypothetical protein
MILSHTFNVCLIKILHQLRSLRDNDKSTFKYGGLSLKVLQMNFLKYILKADAPC